MGFEAAEAPDRDELLEPLDWLALLATGTWAFEGGFTPLRHELAQTLIFDPQVCIHIDQL